MNWMSSLCGVVCFWERKACKYDTASTEAQTPERPWGFEYLVDSAFGPWSLFGSEGFALARIWVEIEKVGSTGGGASGRNGSWDMTTGGAYLKFPFLYEPTLESVPSPLSLKAVAVCPAPK